MPAKGNAYIVAWGLALLFYIVQYSTRSAPGVMVANLEQAFNEPAVGVSAILGTYYYAYALVSLVAGVALDRVGAKYIVPFGAVILGLGCLLFAVDSSGVAYVARILQGTGSAFAFTGAVYLAARGFPPAVLATAVGATQAMGMLGGSAGQFLVGPLIAAGASWKIFWFATGAAGIVVALILVAVTPREQPPGGDVPAGFVATYAIVLRNPQSILCGIVAGLLFAPTTVGMMTWGVAFLQADRNLSYHDAVLAASLVPLGWAVGCPLLGWLADRLGRRKPVVLGGAGAMIVGIAQLTFAPRLLPADATLFLLGIASGAAMIPYTMIKEVNPDQVKGSATGAINFINFAVTSIVGPIFAALYGRTLTGAQDPALHFQQAGTFWLGAVCLALVIGIFLQETGARSRQP